MRTAPSARATARRASRERREDGWSLETGNDHPHDRNAELGPRQVDDQDALQAGTVQALERPRNVLVEGVAHECRPVAKGTQRTCDVKHRASTPHDVQAPGAQIVGADDIIARPGDDGESALGGLRERAQERHFADDVASHPARHLHAVQQGFVSIRDHADEARDADVRGRFPDGDLNVGVRIALQHLATRVIVDRGEIDAGGRLLRGWQQILQRRGVALDDLADAVADRFQEMIAGGEAVGGTHKASRSGRLRQRVIRVNQLERRPHGLGLREVPRLDPEQRQIRMKGARFQTRQRVHVSESVAVTEIRMRHELHRPRDPFGVQGLDRFHQRGGFGGGEIEALAARRDARLELRGTRRDQWLVFVDNANMRRSCEMDARSVIQAA